MFNLFGKKAKKNTTETTCCCCNGEDKQTSCNCEDNAEIKILGGGCAKCDALEENTKQAMRNLGLDLKVGHVKDYEKIAAYGVMSTPALVLNEQVVASGQVLTVKEAEEQLAKVFK